jgi:hypothetical protein
METKSYKVSEVIMEYFPVFLSSLKSLLPPRKTASYLALLKLYLLKRRAFKKKPLTGEPYLAASYSA